MGIGRPDAERMADELHNKSTTEGTLSSGHPLAWLERSNQPTISEERRREIMALGFPDDGYDYLKHVRQGHDAMATSTQSGSSAGQDASERYGGTCPVLLHSQHCKISMHIALMLISSRSVPA